MSRIVAEGDLDRLDFAKAAGLVPTVAQHALTGEVLMLGFANREALASTLRDGELWFHSRSRERQWKKGETSGNVLRLVSLHADCDGDAVLARVLPAGPTCHTGESSCFAAPPTLAALAAILGERAAALAARPSGELGESPSYTQRLLADTNLRLKKLGEEAVELALACTRGDGTAVAAEAADLLYHLLVAAAASRVQLTDVLAALEERRGS